MCAMNYNVSGCLEGGYVGVQAAMAPPVAPHQQGKTGQHFTASAAADMQAPYAEHFPPIRSRRRTRYSPLDAFVLWLDRWRERAVKYTHRGTTTSRGEAANIHNTPVKEKQRGGGNWRHRASDGNLLLATVNFTSRDNATPKINEVCTPALQSIGP